MRTWANRTRLAFTLVEIMVVVSFIGLLVVLAIPSFARARQTTMAQACIENQRAIYNAVVQYEQDTGSSLSSIALSRPAIRNTLVSAGYIKHSSGFQCPASWKNYASYILLYDGSDFTNTACWTFQTSSLHTLQ